MKVALLQLGLFLQGGFHFVIWCLMFLLLLGFFHTRFFLPSLRAILFSILLSAVRILPAGLSYATEENRFISGYFSLSDMLSGFITLKHPSEAQSGMYTSLGWWEVDIYTGLLGLGFLAIFGLYFTWKATTPDGLLHRKLLAPIFGMVVLSIGKIYQPINMLPIPLMDAERVSSRFLIIPVFMAIVVGGISLERWLRTNNLNYRSQLFALTLVGVMAHDLLQHARLWRVENMATLFPRTAVDIRTEIILRPDPPYINSLLIGLGISFLTVVFLSVQVYRERQAAT
jgi:hypothetical protein